MEGCQKKVCLMKSIFKFCFFVFIVFILCMRASFGSILDKKLLLAEQNVFGQDSAEDKALIEKNTTAAQIDHSNTEKSVHSELNVSQTSVYENKSVEQEQTVKKLKSSSSVVEREGLNEQEWNTDLKFDSLYHQPVIEEDKDIDFFWKTVFKFKALSIREDRIDATVHVENYGKFEWQVEDFLSFYNEGLLLGRSGFVQSVYERGDRKSGFHPVDAYLDIKTSFVIFRFGMVKQDFLKAPLLVTDKTFPSMMQQFYFDWDKSKLDIILQSAITNNPLESVTRGKKLNEWPTLFLTSSVFWDLQDIFNFNIKEKLTAFYITNLSSSIAEDSRRYGNSITEGRARFKYAFLGLYNSLSFQTALSDNWMFEIGGDFIHNFAGAVDYNKEETFAFNLDMRARGNNQGERIYGSIYHNYKELMELKLTAEYFSNQSDSSVASFNSELYGHNNRVGGRVVFQSHFYNSGLTFGLSYTGSLPIDETRNQMGFASAVSMFLKTNYLAI